MMKWLGADSPDPHQLPQLLCVLSIPICLNYYFPKLTSLVYKLSTSPNLTWPVNIAHNAFVFDSVTVPLIKLFCLSCRS